MVDRYKLRSLAYLWIALLTIIISGNGYAEPLLAKVYKQPVDFSQWKVSEKLDGVRAIWDGSQLKFRSGKTIHAPRWFVEQFPTDAMDGELWISRGNFDQLSSVVRKKVAIDSEWQQVTFNVFELPNAVGDFASRYLKIQQLVNDLAISWLKTVEQKQIANEEELMLWLDRVVAAKGEGLMLHRSDSLYHEGRSDDLLKLKLWQDAEAVVESIIPGKGKYQGMMGALLVRTAQGVTFKIGTGFSDKQRLSPPAIGTQITYKYTGLTKRGIPRFASFLRIRQE